MSSPEAVQGVSRSKQRPSVAKRRNQDLPTGERYPSGWTRALVRGALSSTEYRHNVNLPSRHPTAGHNHREARMFLGQIISIWGVS